MSFRCSSLKYPNLVHLFRKKNNSKEKEKYFTQKEIINKRDKTTS